MMMTTTSSSSSRQPALHNDNNGNGNNAYEDILDFHYFDDPIASTQDEAKRLLLSKTTVETNDGPNNSHTKNLRRLLAVLARQQDNGRGTQGRTWEGREGNVYLTVAIPLDQIPVTITLLPLQIGVLIAKLLDTYLRPTPTPASLSSLPRDTTTRTTTVSPNDKGEGADPQRLVVKWPNDVLLDNRKVAGVLIENWISPSSSSSSHSHNAGCCWLLIGVGINVAFAPVLPSRVRPATCLQEFCNPQQRFVVDDDDDDRNNNHSSCNAKDIGIQLTHSLIDWVVTSNNNKHNKLALERQILHDWKAWAKFGQVYTLRETGEEVLTLDIQPDGQLKVRGADGQERLLVADYLH